MRVIILVVGLLFTLVLSAQTDSAFESSISPTYLSVNTLTRSDIERLPVFSFMQLVQGAFPFVGNESTVEEEYSFVVNGFILTNPNAINISQVESISFVPVGTNLTRGSLTKKGTFIINTRPEKNGFSFSTHTGWTLPGGSIGFPSVKLTQTKNGFNSSNDISYSHQSKKWFLSNAFSYLKNESPHFRFDITTTDPNLSETDNTSARLNRSRFSNFGGYEFDQHWKAEGSFFFTAKRATANIEHHYRNNYYNPSESSITTETKPKVNYIGGNIGVSTNIHDISNRINFEIAHYRDNTNGRTDYNYDVGQRFANGSMDYHSNGYSISNNFKWKAMQSSSFDANISFLAQYRQAKSSEKKDSLNQFVPVTGPVEINHSGSTRENNSKGFLLSPQVNFSYKKMVFAEVGVSYDTYGEAIFGPNKKKKLFPDAGVRVELASLVNNKFISTLEISGSYSKYLTNFERYDRLGTPYTSNVIPWTFGTSIFIANPALNGYLPVKNWLGSATIGFNSNSILFKAQYRLHEKIIKSFAPAPWYTNFNTIVMITESLNSKSWSFELKATILKNETKSWSIYATTFQDKYSRQYWQYPPTPEDLILLDAEKAPWRSGLRTSATINKFFFQASTLVNFDELSIDRNGNTKEDMTRYNFNFLAFGYALPLKNKAIRGVNISAESNGLFASKSFALAKYIGVGVQVDF